MGIFFPTNQRIKTNCMKRIIILLTLPLLLTGCAVIQINKSSTQSAKQASTGFYRTSNRGETWDFKSSIYTVGGQPRSFSGTNVTAMTMDPTDAKTIYLGSQQNGILYTTNSGDGWQGTLTDQGVVNGIAVDPQNHCIIYAAVYNKVFKTIDCSREWKMIHLSSLSGEFFTAIAVDNQDPRNIFLGTSRGTLLMSKDSGFSWESINFFSSQVSWLSANPNGSKKFSWPQFPRVSSPVRIVARPGSFYPVKKCWIRPRKRAVPTAL